MGSVEDCPPSRLFETIPARPPTPPREALHHDLDALAKQLTSTQQRSLLTPPGLSSPTLSSKDSSTRRKRVGFSAKPHFQEAPAYPEPTSSLRQDPTPASLPPTSSRPVKGILKPTAAPNRLAPVARVLLDGDKPGQVQIAEMLESTLQQLAGADRESKVDAYTMLFRGLKASSNLPDRIALREKMGLFMQFIQRDLTSRSAAGSVDALLVTSALKLLHTFLHFHGVASSIPRDFGIFFIDHCVRSFGDEQPLKETVRHLMQALSLQNFPREVMSSERVGRLVTALHNIESRLSGKSIVQGRIRVFEKLVKQCPQQMAVHSDWTQDLFTDMLSSASEIRSAATKLGLCAAFALNKDKRFVGRVADLANFALEDKKYIELVSDRLNTMLDDEEECVAVPRIWSVITLLIPGVERWDYFRPWSTIIQRCFNHPSIPTNKETILAWSRFAYRTYLDRRLDQQSAIKRIRGPLVSKLKRKGLRNVVLSGIRNFYYYAFRPETSLKMLDELWDSAVAPLMQQLSSMTEEDNANVTQAAAILTSLLDCKTRRVWREDRIADPTLIKDDELPVIDSKWVRTNSARVFGLVGPVLKRGFAEVAVGGGQHQKLWRALVHSVASASAKDVKLHDDTANFVASVLTLLSAVWSEGPGLTVDGQPCSASQFLDAAREFVHILISGLGLLPNPFMDKQFVLTKENKFVVHTKSSHRSSKGQGVRRVPLHHLFLILTRTPTNIPDDNKFADFFASTFAPFFQDKGEKVQANLGQELLRLLPMDAACAYGPWKLCAGKLSTSLEASEPSHQSNHSGSEGNLGPEIRDIVKTLERGLRSTPNLPSEDWTRLFWSLTSRVGDEAGDAGVAIAVVEPLASVISEIVPGEKEDVISNTCVEAAIEILAASTHPRDRQAVDAARRRLWGTSNVDNRSSTFDPFDNLYKLVSGIFEKLYANIGSYELGPVVRLFKEVKSFFDRGHSELRSRAILGLQKGMARCLEDRDHRLTRTEFPGVAEAIRSLWQTLCGVIFATSADKLQLDPIESLLCAAFMSTHRDIVRITAEMWNRLYSSAEEDISYPAKLKEALSSLGPSVDVARPGLELLEGEPDRHANFSQSQAPSVDLLPTPQPRRGVPSLPATPGSASARAGCKGESTAVPRGRVGARGRTPRSKPRHEDSQLEFTTIESSPALVTQTSQVLTDRQREVRERQQENAALFPAIRSSPTEKTKKARSNTSQHQQEVAPRDIARASTPNNGRGFEDCLTSTPTPRRGQAAMLPEQDHDMTDPPSSPPEPRSHRLLAELSAKANEKNAIDEWQFSSSPVTGSPVLAHQAIAATQPADAEEVPEELCLDNEVDGGTSADVPGANAMDVSSSQQEVIEDTTILELPALQQDAARRSPATPSGRQLRSRLVQITPRSDNEEFVDAPSSPLPPTPRRNIARKSHPAATLRRSPRNVNNSQSFAVSASFENGLRGVAGSGRIEIPLRRSESHSPRKKQYTSYKDILPVSPEQGHEGGEEPQQTKDNDEQDVNLGTIEVGGKSSRKSKRGRSRKSNAGSQAGQSSPSTQSLPAPINTTAAVDAADDFENVSPGIGRWWRKRKRSISSVFSSGGGGSKKARHYDVLDEQVRHDEVPDSQSGDVPAEGVPASPDRGVDTQIVEEAYEYDDSFDSDLGSSPVLQRQRELSEELSALYDHHPAAETGSSVAETAADADVPMEDMADHGDDDDEAIFSQLIREEQEAKSVEKAPPQGPPGDAATAAPGPAVSGPTTTTPAERAQEQQQPPAVEVEAEPNNKFDGLMALLRNGVETLRSADLTRDQFYEAEDLFFEMKRELLEAERRGRSRG